MGPAGFPGRRTGGAGNRNATGRACGKMLQWIGNEWFPCAGMRRKTVFRGIRSVRVRQKTVFRGIGSARVCRKTVFQGIGGARVWQKTVFRGTGGARVRQKTVFRGIGSARVWQKTVFRGIGSARVRRKTVFRSIGAGAFPAGVGSGGRGAGGVRREGYQSRLVSMTQFWMKMSNDQIGTVSVNHPTWGLRALGRAR